MTFPEVLNLNHLIEEYSSSPNREQETTDTYLNGPDKDDDGKCDLAITTGPSTNATFHCLSRFRKFPLSQCHKKTEVQNNFSTDAGSVHSYPKIYL